MKRGEYALLAVVALALVATAARADIGDAPEMPGAIVRPPKRRPCELETRVRGRRTRDGVLLEAVMRNRSKSRVEVTLRNACPGGSAQLWGLPNGYDVYSACNRGACVDTSPIRVGLAPGAERVIASTTIRTGGDACNGPLPAGVYRIVAQPRFERVEAEACGTEPYRFAVGGALERQAEPRVEPPAREPTVAPPPRREPRPIPCGLGCPNGVLDSVRCTCKKLELLAPSSSPR